MGALPPLPLGGPGTQQGHRCLECCGWLSTGLEVKRLAALGDLDPTQQKAESSRPSLPGPCQGEPPSLRRARWLSGPTPPLGHVSNPFMLLLVPWHCLQNIQGPHPSSGPQTRRPNPFSLLLLPILAPSTFGSPTTALLCGPSCPPTGHCALRAAKLVYLLEG